MRLISILSAGAVDKKTADIISDACSDISWMSFAGLFPAENEHAADG